MTTTHGGQDQRKRRHLGPGGPRRQRQRPAVSSGGAARI